MALTNAKKAAAAAAIIEEDPPSASSETIESGDSESDSGEESEEIPTPTTQTKKPESAVLSKPQSEDDEEGGSSDGEESGSEEEESDHELVKRKVLVSDIKPVSSKPMDVEPVEPTKKSKRTVKPSKRALEAEKSEKETKSKKKKVEDGAVEVESEKKNDKPLIVRIWNEDDETVILEGLLGLAKKGMNPNKLNPDLVIEEFKGKLSIDVDKVKLMSKIAKIKQKYHNHVKKKKDFVAKGKELNFKPREKQNYEMFKKLWGSNGDNDKGEHVVNGNAVSGKSGENGKLDEKKKAKKPASNGDIGKVAAPSPKKKPAAKLVEAPVHSMVPSPNIEGVEGTNSWSEYPSIIAVLAKPGESSKVPSFEMDLRFKAVGPNQKAKAEELERKWKDLKGLELKNYLMRLQLTQDTLRLVSGLHGV